MPEQVQEKPQCQMHVQAPAAIQDISCRTGDRHPDTVLDHDMFISYLYQLQHLLISSSYIYMRQRRSSNKVDKTIAVQYNTVLVFMHK